MCCILRTDNKQTISFFLPFQYNRGKRARQDSWVFGIVSTQYTASRGYFQVVERRDAGTLLPLIQRCLLPGTESATDDWAAYSRVNTLPNVAAHRVVVHARHSMDPRTGVYTNEAESSWSRLKLGQKRRKGLRKEDLQGLPRRDNVAAMEKRWPGCHHA